MIYEGCMENNFLWKYAPKYVVFLNSNHKFEADQNKNIKVNELPKGC